VLARLQRSCVRSCLVGLACLAGLCAATRVARAEDSFTGPDKTLHFAATSLLAVSGYTLALSLDASRDVRFAAAFGLPLFAGAAKELFDAATGGDASRGDLAWDLIGTMTGVTLSWLFGELLFASSPAATSQAPARAAPPRLLLLREVTTER
jgi:putative lipoprotein